MGKIIYILSDNRSGSTLLDQLLGAHGQVVSLGEVHHLPAYAHENRALYNPAHPLECSCGVRLACCPFWQSVERNLGRSLKSLVLMLRFHGWIEKPASRIQVFKSLPKRVIGRHPNVFLSSIVQFAFNSTRVASDSFDLFDAVFAETGAKYLVDSSKTAFRFRSLYEHRPDSMVAIVLGRDYRGVVQSKMKRGDDLESGATTWATRMREIKALTHDVPPRELIRVKYEELCEDPRGQLGRLCDFLQLDFTENLLTRPVVDIHHVGGSPSKFDSRRRAIKLDQSYRDAFTAKELAVMKEIVGDIAREWDYA